MIKIKDIFINSLENFRLNLKYVNILVGIYLVLGVFVEPILKIINKMILPFLIKLPGGLWAFSVGAFTLKTIVSLIYLYFLIIFFRLYFTKINFPQTTINKKNIITNINKITFWRALIVSLIISLAIGIGIGLFVIPGIVILTYLFFAFYYVIIEEKTIKQSFTKSILIAKKNFLKIFITYSLIILSTILILSLIHYTITNSILNFILITVIAQYIFNYFLITSITLINKTKLS